MPNKHKKLIGILGMITLMLAIFFAGIAAVYYMPFSGTGDIVQGSVERAAGSPVVYYGIKGQVAVIFTGIFTALMDMTGGSVLLSVVILGFLIEMLLLYFSVRIQLKQKKIHLFHKKLVDRFTKGELSVSKTEEELWKLYDVNEKIHKRGAWLVGIQVAVFFFAFWGMNLMVSAPELLRGSWNLLNFSLLSKAQGLALPLVASLLYIAHSMIKIYFKGKEDYISSAQTTIAVLFALIGTGIVFIFASYFASALVLLFITLITFSAIRYIIVERRAKEWGEFARQELIQMLREAGPHKNRFEYFSRLWRHIPVVRHINFNLLEEAISMSLGLLLALTFFGAFTEQEPQISAVQFAPYAIHINNAKK